MKKLKQILAIAMVVMVGVVFTPIMPGVNGEANAASSNEIITPNTISATSADVTGVKDGDNWNVKTTTGKGAVNYKLTIKAKNDVSISEIKICGTESLKEGKDKVKVKAAGATLSLDSGNEKNVIAKPEEKETEILEVTVSAPNNVNVFVSSIIVTYTKKHTHNFTYSADNGNHTITATCSNQDGNCDLDDHKVSVVLKADNAQYTGKAYEATVEGKETWEKAKAAELSEIKYKERNGDDYLSSAPKETGDYSAVLALKDDDTESVTVDFTISPIKLTVKNTKANEKIYDGTTNAVIVLGTVEGILDSDKGNKQTPAKVKVVASGFFKDKNAGDNKDVTVSYSLEGEHAGHYSAPDSENVNANIKQVQLTVEGTTADDKEYDGTNEAVVKMGTLKGVVSPESVSAEIDTKTFNDEKVGTNKTVTVVYKLKGEGSVLENYIKPVNGVFGGKKITKKKVTVPTPAESSFTYNGEAQTGVILPTNAVFTLEDNVKIDAGDYKAKAKLKDKDNYEWNLSSGNKTADQEILWKINKKTVNVTADNKESIINKPFVTDLTYKADKLIGEDKYSGNLTLPKDAKNDKVANYDILLGTLTAGGNYSINYTKGTYSVVDKYSQTISFSGVTGGELSKDFGENNFTEKVSGDKTAVSYSSSETDVAEINASTGEVTIKNAGETVITATATETEDYKSAEATYTLIVNPAKVKVPTAKTNLKYNGNVQHGVEESLKYNLSGNNGIDADSYTATAQLKSKTNYVWDLATPTTEDQEIPWSIAKSEVTLTSASASKVHDGTPLTAETVYVTGDGFASGEGATYTFTKSQTDIGTSENYFTYELNSNTKKENYNITEVYGTLTVTKQDEFAVIFDAQGHGTAPAPQVVVGGEKVKKPADLSEEGYIFGGWFADKDCKNAWDFDNNTVTQNITLYAKWTEKTAIEDCEIVLSHEAYEFNNKVQIPNVTLTDPNGKILEEDKDYRFELEDSKNVGTYAVVVEGIGAYKGGASASYVINPASKSIKSIKAGKKKLTVKWTKRTGAYKEQTTGYQIKYSTSKSFKNAKNAYAKKAGATSKTIKNLKAKKKYYVKMRTYKTVDGQKYYSSWSKVKTKKTR